LLDNVIGRSIWVPAIASPLLACIVLSGCHRGRLPGTTQVPPGVVYRPGVFQDICPRWSHDGKQIAFLRSTTDRKLQLMVATADLSSSRPLGRPAVVSPDRPYATGLTSYSTPHTIAWSPDDRFICFSRADWLRFPDGDVLAATGLFQCEIATGAVNPMATHPSPAEDEYYFFHAPRWSPDGKRLAFLGEQIHGQTALYVRTIPGTSSLDTVHRFDQYDDVGWPAWSPDGTKLAFRQRIRRALTADPIETIRIMSPGRPESRTVFKISPAGDWKLPNQSNRGGSRAKTSNGTNELTTRAMPQIAGIAWSPNGKRIAFGISDDAKAKSHFRIRIAPVDGSGESLVTEPAEQRQDVGFMAPVWINPRRIGTVRTHEIKHKTSYDAVEIDVSMDQVKELCHLASDDLDWSPDRRAIVVATPGMKKPAGNTTLRVLHRD